MSCQLDQAWPVKNETSLTRRTHPLGLGKVKHKRHRKHTYWCDSPMNVILPDLKVDIVKLLFPICSCRTLGHKVQVGATSVGERQPCNHINTKILVLRKWRVVSQPPFVEGETPLHIASHVHEMKDPYQRRRGLQYEGRRDL